MKYIPWILAIVLLVVYGRERQESGKRAERIAQLEQSKSHVEVVYRTKIVHSARATKTYEAKRDSALKNPLDSVLTRAVLLSADTAIAACNYVIQTCEQRVSVRDSLIVQLKKQRAKRFGCVAGAAATPKGIGIGAACGIRVL